MTGAMTIEWSGGTDFTAYRFVWQQGEPTDKEVDAGGHAVRHLVVRPGDLKPIGGLGLTV
jgi:hypothetical protein